KFHNITPAAGEESGKRTPKSQFYIKITPGVSIVSASMKNTAASQFTVDLDKKVIFRIGAEAEYILPYNKNKWSVFVNPAYQKYEDEKDYSVYSGFISNPQTPYHVK
ncbi:hypothetical protein D0809_29250, partial [Flavobacterium circumlabens]